MNRPPPPTPSATPTPIIVPDCLYSGDVNLDGQITAGDAQGAFEIALELFFPSYQAECAADCNGDGNVSAGDAQWIFGLIFLGPSCADPMD